MARAVWTGAITFGLVTIPVGLYSATEDHTIHFHQYERGTSDRVRNERVNERTGEEVESGDVVKGRDVGGGEIVEVEPGELTEIAPDRSESLEIQEFVELADVDPVHFQRTYWVAPREQQYAHPYSLLRQALERCGRAGIGTVVLRGREYLAALRADGDVLALQTLHFADEVRDPNEEVDTLPVEDAARPQEIDMAVRLIESMSADWHPQDYRDTYTERVEQLLADRQEGRETVAASPPEEATEVSDLFDALSRSVEAAGPGRGGAPSDSDRSDSDRSDSDRSDSDRGGGSRGSGGGRGAGGDGVDDLAGLSKAELGRRARELGVRGRSSMNRDELARAVADAGRGSAPAARAS